MSTPSRVWRPPAMGLQPCVGCWQAVRAARAPAAPSRPLERAHPSARDDDQAPRSFTAHFELQGSAQTPGRLELSTLWAPWMARLQWSPDRSHHGNAQERRMRPTFEALLREVTGEPCLPMMHCLTGSRASPPWPAAGIGSCSNWSKDA